MIRRPSAAVLALLLAACGSASNAQPPSPVPETIAFPPAPASAAMARAPGPLAPTGDPTFDAWRADFIRRSGPAWAPLIQRELYGVTPDPRVIANDTRQPEFSRPIGAYAADAASATRIANARSRMAGVPQLSLIEQRFGVPKEILLAVWGMESSFGAIQGDYDIVRSMATLASHGRRRAFAETQLYAALRMIADGRATRAQMVGSWAGGMGQTQFIPDTYLTTAVDGDGDGRADIWRSPADALGSAANLLKGAGWRTGQPWAIEVSAPARFDYALVEDTSQPLSAWAAAGLTRADRATLAAPGPDAWRLILPAGARGPAFLVGANHDAIRAYNNSVAYALSIGFIADALQGRSASPRTPWPNDPPLSLADRQDAQRLLTARGFDTQGVDGVTGSNTRRALRAWQRARGRVPDGYLNGDTLAALRVDPASPARP